MERRPLYIILGIPTDATPEEVRRAYHRQALRYHPDKAGPEGTEKFSQVLAAYTLLSDPDAREVYDRYGEQGLTNMDVMPAMAEISHTMSVVVFFRITFAVLTILCALGFLFLLLVVIKIDKEKSWNWMVVCWPAFAAGAVVGLVVVLSAYLRIKKYIHWYRRAKSLAKTDDSSTASTDARPCGCSGVGQCGLHFGGCPPAASSNNNAAFHQATPEACKQACQLNRHVFIHEATYWVRNFSVMCLLSTFGMVCALAQQMALSDGEFYKPRRFSWWITFGPCIVASVLSIAYIGQFRRALLLRGVHEICSYMLFILNALSFIMWVCKITQAILLPLALENVIDCSPMTVAIPAIIFFITRYAKLVCLEVARVRGLNKFAERQCNPNARSGCSAVRISNVSPDEKIEETVEADNYSGGDVETHNPEPKQVGDEISDGDEVVEEERPEPAAPVRYGFTQSSFVLQVGLESVSHILILLTIILTVGRSSGWDISMTAALAPALLLFGLLGIVFAILYSCFSIYISSVKQEEKQKRKTEEREQAAEVRRQRQERRETRRREEAAAVFTNVQAPAVDPNAARSHYHGRDCGAFYWGYPANAPPPTFPEPNIMNHSPRHQDEEEYVRTPFTPRNDFEHYAQLPANNNNNNKEHQNAEENLSQT
eukprot:GILJ01018971.1.p1 GENE.GILJ01018971.1~~GILJ01018971.1.p1  ORF type:complete len:656 (-),score=73.32 GILJ01018971.1:44-2011(-)